MDKKTLAPPELAWSDAKPKCKKQQKERDKKPQGPNKDKIHEMELRTLACFLERWNAHVYKSWPIPVVEPHVALFSWPCHACKCVVARLIYFYIIPASISCFLEQCLCTLLYGGRGHHIQARMAKAIYLTSSMPPCLLCMPACHIPQALLTAFSH